LTAFLKEAERIWKMVLFGIDNTAQQQGSGCGHLWLRQIIVTGSQLGGEAHGKPDRSEISDNNCIPES
jgi:hypothetical protein